MTDEFEYDDYCYECGAYGDDYRYDEETGEWICNCDDYCPVMKTEDDYD